MELKEYAGITEALGYYARGAAGGDSDLMKRAFHDSAQIYGYLDGDLLADPIKALYDYVEEHPPAESLEYAVRSVDRSGDAATARVEISNWHEHTYTDFFTLLKVGGQWKITNKIFTQH